MPHVKTLFNSTVHVSVSRPTIGACEYRRAAKAVRNAVKVKRKHKTLEFRVSAANSVSFAPHFSEKRAPVKPDFQSDRGTYAPGLTTPGSATVHQTDSTQHQPLAEDVG